MKQISDDKLGVILLAMGGPEKLSDIRQYLYNIFSDREIIQLPGGKLFQKLFAKIISSRRCKKVEEHYKLIGGGSPLLKWTNSQADQLKILLNDNRINANCYIGMRYFNPTINAAIERARADGCHRLLFLPLYPQYCRATTGSSLSVIDSLLSVNDKKNSITVKDFHDHPTYIALLRDYIDNNIAPDETVLFSAHSIPQKFVKQGDPYVEQIKKTAALVAGEREYFLSFQSRSGPVTWVGPDTIAEAVRLSAQEKKKLFVVPISFVCDHIETMHEIDIQLSELVKDAGGLSIRRMPMFNDDPRFAQLLFEIVNEKVAMYVG